MWKIVGAFLFFNIVLMWKIVGASEASVLYIYIDNDTTNFTIFLITIDKQRKEV